MRPAGRGAMEVASGRGRICTVRMNLPQAYAELLAELERVGLLKSSLALLGWDEQVMLPPGSAGFRGRQSAALADLVHREATSPRLGDRLAAVESRRAELDADQQVVVHHARRDYNRLTKIPAGLVAEKAALDSEAYHVWARARRERDFAAFAPCLQHQLDLAARIAGCFGKSGAAAYDYAIDQFDPGMDAATIGRLFDALSAELVPFAAAVMASPVKARRDRLKGFAVDRQEAFLREVTAAIGFDYQRGRLDRSLHPFCAGNGFDTRLTTRFDPDDPLQSLFGSIHEAGHGMYEQGLPASPFGSALTEAVGMGVHESQSRLWENQVGRSAPFWQYWEPRYRALFPEQLAGLDAEGLLLAVNAVGRQPIRVEADEVFYNLHIMLRFRLERALFAGELAVKDLPGAWNELSRSMLGLEPRDDAEGCLQDVHWSGGAFGYFPSYCLGNMIAAQLWETARRALPGLDDELRAGGAASLHGWLRREVHGRGKQLDTRALTLAVTGEELGPKALLRYLKGRYGALYRVG